MHNHILPGIDDGAVGIEEAHKIRIALKDRGIDTCIYTPHIYKEIHPNNLESIKSSFTNLMSNVHYTNEFKYDRFAAEYMIDNNFEEMLFNKSDFLFIKDNTILIVFPIVAPPKNLQEIIYNLILNGIQPIIAHPERYLYLNTSKTNSINFIKLKDMGCEFQLNIMSLIGQYGNKVHDLAIQLLGLELYDYASTDIHNTYQIYNLDKLLHSFVWKKWSKYPFKNQTLL